MTTTLPTLPERGFSDTRPLAPEELTEQQRDVIQRFERIMEDMQRHTVSTSSTAGVESCDPQGWSPFFGDTVEVDRRHGVVVFDGARGSGKTATMLTALNGLNQRDRKPDILALRPVSFDQMPDAMHAFAMLVANIGQAVTWLTDRDGIMAANERRDLQQEHCEVFEAALGWKLPAIERESVRDFAVEQIRVDRGWLSLERRWRGLVDRLLKGLQAAGRLSPTGLLLLPIDDMDLQAGHARELLLAFRHVRHPRICVVLTADLEHLRELLAWEIAGEMQRHSGVRGVDRELMGSAERLAAAALDKAIPVALRLGLRRWSLQTFLEKTCERCGLTESANASRTTSKPGTSKRARSKSTKSASDDARRRQQTRAAALVDEMVGNPLRARHGILARQAEQIWHQLRGLDAEQRADPAYWKSVVLVRLAQQWLAENLDFELDSNAMARDGHVLVARPLSDHEGPVAHAQHVWEIQAADGTFVSDFDERGTLLLRALSNRIRPRPMLDGKELDLGTGVLPQVPAVYAFGKNIRRIFGQPLPWPEGILGVMERHLASNAVEGEHVVTAADVVAAFELRGRIGKSLAADVRDDSALIGAAAAEVIDHEWADFQLASRLLWLTTYESGLPAEDRYGIVKAWQVWTGTESHSRQAAQARQAAIQVREAHLRAQTSAVDGDSSRHSLQAAADKLDTDGRAPWRILFDIPGPNFLSWSLDSERHLGVEGHIGKSFWSHRSDMADLSMTSLRELIGANARPDHAQLEREANSFGKALIELRPHSAAAYEFTERLIALLPTNVPRSIDAELQAIFDTCIDVGLQPPVRWRLATDSNGWITPVEPQTRGSCSLIAKAGPALPLESLRVTGLTVLVPRWFTCAVGLDAQVQTSSQHPMDFLGLLALTLRCEDRNRVEDDDDDGSVLFQHDMIEDAQEDSIAPKLPWPTGMSYFRAARLARSVEQFVQSQPWGSMGVKEQRRWFFVAIVQMTNLVLNNSTMPFRVVPSRQSGSLVEQWEQAISAGQRSEPHAVFGTWMRNSAWKDLLNDDQAFLECWTKLYDVPKEPKT